MVESEAKMEDRVVQEQTHLESGSEIHVSILLVKVHNHKLQKNTYLLLRGPRPHERARKSAPSL